MSGPATPSKWRARWGAFRHPIAGEKADVLRAGLGEDLVKSYLKLKHDDWNAYSRHLTDWERQTTLDC